MSYAKGIEVTLTPVTSSGAPATHVGPDVSLAATTPVAKWAPGYFTHKLHAVSIVLTDLPSNFTANTPISFFHYRPFSGTDTATLVAQLNMATTMNRATGPAGIFHRVTANVNILPGEALVVQPTTAATAGVRGLCCAYVSPNYEQPTIGLSATGHVNMVPTT